MSTTFGQPWMTKSKSGRKIRNPAQGDLFSAIFREKSRAEFKKFTTVQSDLFKEQQKFRRIRSKILGKGASAVGLGFGYSQLYKGLTGRQGDAESAIVGGALGVGTVSAYSKGVRSEKYKRSVKVSAEKYAKFRVKHADKAEKVKKFKKVLRRLF